MAQTLAHTFVLVPGVRFAYARSPPSLGVGRRLTRAPHSGTRWSLASSLQKFARRMFVAPASGPLVAAAFADEGHVVERIHGLLGDEVAYGGDGGSPVRRCSWCWCSVLSPVARWPSPMSALGHPAAAEALMRGASAVSSALSALRVGEG